VGIEKGEEIASKGRDNTFNKRTTRNFPNLVIERDIQTRKVRPPNRQVQKNKQSKTYYI
jgi:hypothetical protein